MMQIWTKEPVPAVHPRSAIGGAVMLKGSSLVNMSVREMSSLIVARKLSPVEVVEGAISRIEESNPAINAFVYFGF